MLPERRPSKRPAAHIERICHGHVLRSKPNGSRVPPTLGAAGDWKDTISGIAIDAPGLRGVTGDSVLFGSSALGDVDLERREPKPWRHYVSPARVVRRLPRAGTGGSLLLDNGAGPATLTVAAGSHTISAPVVLDSNAVAIPAAGSQLTISGAISGAGQSLSVGGSGTGGSGTVVLAAPIATRAAPSSPRASSSWPTRRRSPQAQA